MRRAYPILHILLIAAMAVTAVVAAMAGPAQLAGSPAVIAQATF
jgi:hypothetical protein